ncbi:MAG: inositol monophosphatase family protein [Gammaproteobacteria bacterium]|nr:MAG: inositol monophosphatase family protein [Gammaproteobacteria bacterium]
MTDLREEVSTDRRRELLDAALELADLCAETTASIVESGFEVSQKADDSLVTTADVETERAFRKRIEERFPDMGLLGEELGESNPGADFRWIIDPIDGTAEFARHLPVYGCIIGLHYKQQPLLGVIDHQALGIRCHAAYELGAFANGQRLRIDDRGSGEKGAVARIGLPSLAGFLSPTDAASVFRAIVDTYPNFRTYHTCYAHTLAVMGGLDAAMEWHTPLWDVAATQILIEEAGGRYQRVKGAESPAQGHFHSAVFGKPAVVDRLAGIIEDALSRSGEV